MWSLQCFLLGPYKKGGSCITSQCVVYKCPIPTYAAILFPISKPFILWCPTAKGSRARQLYENGDAYEIQTHAARGTGPCCQPWHPQLAQTVELKLGVGPWVPWSLGDCFIDLHVVACDCRECKLSAPNLEAAPPCTTDASMFACVRIIGLQ